ncbi:hypothetical protein P4S68_04925 [Pseudoalteromonas sp. Hal099]
MHFRDVALLTILLWQYRYSVFARGHRYLPNMRNTQDYFLWIALAKDGCKFANVKEPLLHF